MEIQKGKCYTLDNSDIIVKIVSIKYENRNFYKARCLLFHKRLNVVYENKIYRLYKNKIKHWKQTADNKWSA